MKLKKLSGVPLVPLHKLTFTSPGNQIKLIIIQIKRQMWSTQTG